MPRRLFRRVFSTAATGFLISVVARTSAFAACQKPCSGSPTIGRLPPFGLIMLRGLPRPHQHRRPPMLTDSLSLAASLPLSHSEWESARTMSRINEGTSVPEMGTVVSEPCPPPGCLPAPATPVQDSDHRRGNMRGVRGFGEEAADARLNAELRQPWPPARCLRARAARRNHDRSAGVAARGCAPLWRAGEQFEGADEMGQGADATRQRDGAGVDGGRMRAPGPVLRFLRRAAEERRTPRPERRATPQSSP